MSLKQVYVCDRCGREAPTMFRTFVVTGRSMTPAGSTEDDGDHVDLCCKCLEVAFGLYALGDHQRKPADPGLGEEAMTAPAGPQRRRRRTRQGDGDRNPFRFSCLP